MDQAGIRAVGQLIGKYKYVFLILILGIVLMLIPSKAPTEKNASVSEPTASPTLQEQLSILLSTMDGAGKVTVLLTEAKGESIHYQTNAESDTRTNTVILNDSSRNQSGLIRQVDPPVYLGAIVLCQGADRPSVRLAITQAVANATGLGFDRITILKMK